MKVGRRVRVRNGPVQGMEGIFVRKKNGSQFVISLDLIVRSVATEIDVAELEPVHCTRIGPGVGKPAIRFDAHV